MRLRNIAAATLLAAASTSAVLVAWQQRPANVEIVAHVVKPEPLPAAPDQLAQLKLPAGFTVSVFAEGLGKPRMLAVADDGSVYVTRREPGDVLVLRDTDGDGRAEYMRTAVRRPMLHGIALDGQRAYLVGVNDVFSAERQADGTFGKIVRIVHDLPEAGQHPNRTIAVGPDRHLYVSVGSTCNACDETSPELATLLRVTPDGQSRRIFASGLRNTIGFGWHPESGTLFGFDHGIDWLGDNDQNEELNRIEEGERYGWPYVYANGKLNPQDEPPGEVTGEEWAKLSVEPLLTYTAHAAPMQMAFYTGAQFPAEYRGDALVAMHGSWNRKPPSGYEVVRVRFRNGAPAAIEPFLAGFLSDRGGKPAMSGRPVGVAMDRQGAVLVSDDLNGRIFRITHSGASTSRAPAGAAQSAAPSASPMEKAVKPGAASDGNTALAAARPETKTTGTLTVTSTAFATGQPIPEPYTAYGERFSPALSWSGAPPTTRSFVLMMEDPDAKEPRPFVHWLMYNLPATTTSLPENVPSPLRLPEPEGAMQGVNSRGSAGYMGPRPPAGDPPHHYHFQVFALSSMLTLPPGAKRTELLAAMHGHVVARGEVVGTFQRPR